MDIFIFEFPFFFTLSYNFFKLSDVLISIWTLLKFTLAISSKLTIFLTFILLNLFSWFSLSLIIVSKNDLEEITKLNYNNVHIEIDTSDSLKKLYESIKEKGDSKIQISIAEENKNYLFELKDKRKFDFETLKYLNREPYIKKINV